MTDARTNDVDDQIATRIVKLIGDLDAWIRALRGIVTGKMPWERALIGLLEDADRCIQILRMTAAMQKSDVMITQAAVDLAVACRRMELAVQGSRADSFVRSSVSGAGKVGTALSRLVLSAASIMPTSSPTSVKPD